MAAIARHNSINEGGGNIATLNGDRINISPDNIQKQNHFLPEVKEKTRISISICIMQFYCAASGRSKTLRYREIFE